MKGLKYTDQRRKIHLMHKYSWQDLYSEHSNHYDRLVQSEDYQSNLMTILRQSFSIDHKSVVEFGAGTGRITAQLVPYVKAICSFDLTPAMIRVAHRKLMLSGYSNWQVGVADSRAIPASNGCADIAIEGWSFVQIMAWNRENWREEVGKAIREMLRVVRPGGMLVLVETLGTGETSPKPPDLYKPVYDYFESEWSFSSRWIRTDFCFPSHVEAEAIIGPVFGQDILERVVETEQGSILPECTGIWWRNA